MKIKEEVACRDEEEVRLLKAELEANKFDKAAYLKELEQREQDVRNNERKNNRDKAFLEEQIKSKAYELEKKTISDCKNEIEKAKKLYSEKIEDFKKQCESEKSEVISKYEKMIREEEELIKSKSDKIIDEYRAELDEEHQNLQKDMDTQLKEKKKELEAENVNEKEQMESSSKRYNALRRDLIGKSGAVIIFCFVSAIVSLYSVVVAFTHGLLPILIPDCKEFAGWIANDWIKIFSSPFGFGNVFAILKLLLPVIILMIIGIWTATDFDIENKQWVVLADKVSIAVFGSAVSLSAIFGVWLAKININTVVLPFLIYFVYFLIRSGFLEGLFEIIGAVIEAIRDYLHEQDSNQVIGNLLLIVVVAAIVIYIIFSFKK